MPTIESPSRAPHSEPRTRAYSLLCQCLILFSLCSLAHAADGPSIWINRNRNFLVLFVPGREAQRFPVATGRNLCTPLGHFTIVTKQKDRGGPFGSRFMGLSIWGPSGAQYGVHGTNQPRLIGQHVSHGCIRMFNSDAETVYAQAPIGTPVTIVGGDEDPTALHVATDPPLAQVTLSLPGGQTQIANAPFDVFLDNPADVSLCAEAAGYRPATTTATVQHARWENVTLRLDPFRARRLAFIRDESLCILEPDAKDPTLIEVGGHPRSPTFTPDAQRVVLCDDGRLLAVDLSSGETTAIPLEATALSAACSPTSDTLAVVTTSPDGCQLQELDLSGQLLAGASIPAEPLQRPEWHPSGQSLSLVVPDTTSAILLSAALPLCGLLPASQQTHKLVAWAPSGDTLAAVLPSDGADWLALRTTDEPGYRRLAPLPPEWSAQGLSWGPSLNQLTLAVTTPLGDSSLWTVALTTPPDWQSLQPSALDPSSLW